MDGCWGTKRHVTFFLGRVVFTIFWRVMDHFFKGKCPTCYRWWPTTLQHASHMKLQDEMITPTEGKITTLPPFSQAF